MWELKYNSGYSLFYEFKGSKSYFRSAYDVYVNDKLILEDQVTNTFSIYFKTLDKPKIVIKSTSIEYEQEIELFDTNYYVDISNYLLKDDYNIDITSKLQAVLLAVPDNTTVYFPAATYHITSLFLRSNLKLVFEPGVVFNISTKRELFPIIPDIVEDKQFANEKCLSTWEGNPQASFSSIITGYNLQNIEIVGEVKIEGNASYENWWDNPKQLNVAWRPKTIFLNNCQNVIIHGLSIYNSPSWTIHPFYCNDICFYDVYINNPKDSPNTDGINPESCRNIEINGCNFNLGDDCIAIKSGKIYMAKNHYQPTENIRIVNCKMEHGHGAIVLGSEIACGVKHLEIMNCYFNDTDRGLRVKTRRGRGEKSIIDDITFTNILMNDVRAPITLNAYYKCDPDGNSDYVASRESVSLPEDTPILGKFSFDNLECKNIHQVICMAYGLPEINIEKIQITNSNFSFAQESIAGYPLMMRDEVLVKNTIFDLLNVNHFIVTNNKFENCNRQNKTYTNVSVIKDESNEYC